MRRIASALALALAALGARAQDGPTALGCARDPALPRAAADAVCAAGEVAWRAFERASGVASAKTVSLIVVAGAPGPARVERSEERTLRAILPAGEAVPEPAEAERRALAVARELARFWHEATGDDDASRPWLDLGDAEWAALNALHEEHLLSDAAFLRRLGEAIDACLQARGETPEASAGARRDDTAAAACGVALHLLGWAELRRRDPAAIDSALERWGQLHRPQAALDVAAFARFFDGARGSLMRELLLDDKTPFASTYRHDLAGLVLVQLPPGDPPRVRLPADTLRRLYLLARPVYAGRPPAAPVALASAPNR